jgi:hypothetical protein
VVSGCCNIADVKGKIPVPVIAEVAALITHGYTHDQIDQLMAEAGIPGDPPTGNKFVKTRAWLARANADSNPDPLATLGRVLVELMEVDVVGYGVAVDRSSERARVQNVLSVHGLSYLSGGHLVSSGATAVSRNIEEVIRSHDLPGLQTEFDRISSNIESDPAAAVTASCALLESLFKVFIAEEHLQLPSDKSIKPLWNVVRKNLKLEPEKQQNDDVRAVLVGLGSVVEGLGSLRTHKGSAHGHETQKYKVKPRHARLTSHAAFTVATFVIETWAERKQ